MSVSSSSTTGSILFLLEALFWDRSDFDGDSEGFLLFLSSDEEYEYFLAEELELKDQTMLPETKEILFNLFRDYLATPE